MFVVMLLRGGREGIQPRLRLDAGMSTAVKFGFIFEGGREGGREGKMEGIDVCVCV